MTLRVNSRIAYAVNNNRSTSLEMQNLILDWKELTDHDRMKIEVAMRPILDLPGVGGLVALELAAKIGIFLIKNGVTEL